MLDSEMGQSQNFQESIMLKVYLADDSPLIRDRLKEVITEHGLQVIGPGGSCSICRFLGMTTFLL